MSDKSSLEPAMYFGGMIISGMGAAYRYETALVEFINRRNQMFEGDNTFWGRFNISVFRLTDEMDFPDEAFYYIPSDPLVVIPFFRHRAILLKRRYLNRVRLKLMKELRH